jgi:hypothetical protein
MSSKDIHRVKSGMDPTSPMRKMTYSLRRKFPREVWAIPLYSFSFIDGEFTRDPFIELRFPNDEAAKLEARLTAGDLDQRYRLGETKRWLRGEIVVHEGDREVLRVPVNRD